MSGRYDARHALNMSNPDYRAAFYEEKCGALAARVATLEADLAVLREGMDRMKRGADSAVLHCERAEERVATLEVERDVTIADAAMHRRAIEARAEARVATLENALRRIADDPMNRWVTVVIANEALDPEGASVDQ